ncbi:hypothetical protein LCGC14_1462300 [marine sediment metagenome]|uniref:Uncharacterized protein n=1 Tax=marine sediment metagenome TaxID=412755 RepID=A0A0F9JFD2_9ZZZZ
MPTLIAIDSNSGYWERRSPVAGAYAQAHDVANADAVYNDPGSIQIGQFYRLFPTEYYEVFRGAMIFDTSSIPVGSTMVSATLALIARQLVGASGFSVVLVSGVGLADVFVVADFGDLLAAVTSFGAVVIANPPNETVLTITLNAAGLAAIVPGGTTRFGLRSSLDISNTPPVGGTEQGLLYGSGTVDKEPELTINYDLPVPVVSTDPATGVT